MATPAIDPQPQSQVHRPNEPHPPQLTMKCNLFLSKKIDTLLSAELPEFSIELRQSGEQEKINKLMVMIHMARIPSPSAYTNIREADGEMLDSIAKECLVGGTRPWLFETMVQNKSSYYLHILHIYEDNGLFMRERLDAHFEIKALSLLHKIAVGVRYYTQVYSFRFPVHGSIQMSCQLHFIIHVDEDGNLSRYVRGALSGVIKSTYWFVNPSEDGYEDRFITVYHPTAFIFRVFQYTDALDTHGNRARVAKCMEKLEEIEKELKYLDSPGNLSVKLNNLSKELGQVRISIQYSKAAASTMRSHADSESERNTNVVLDGIEVHKRHEDYSTLREKILDGFQSNEIGLDLLYSISSFEKICDQRLLEVELIQRGADNALLVVSNLLARKEIQWQHNMDTSQRTIAIMTMFFLPATFFAILFTLPLFNWDKPDEPVIRPKIWIYWVFTGASTVAIFALYFFCGPGKKIILWRSSDEESQADREVNSGNGNRKQK